MHMETYCMTIGCPPFYNKGEDRQQQIEMKNYTARGKGRQQQKMKCRILLTCCLALNK